MAIKNRDIFDLVEEFAPRHLAENWDNAGLQIGAPSAEVKRILLSLDMDRAVLHEAVENNIDLIITHHPILMKGIKNINTDTPLGELIQGILKNGITVYAAHTNLDIANDGVNSVLAEMIGLKDVSVLQPTGSEKYLKLVVFVPVTHVNEVRAAITGAGAGWIGNYSDCTFQTTGVGTFRPLEETNPYIGKHGELEQVEEVRLETIVSKRNISAVINEMINAHPYEEVAYDLYPLKNEGPAYGLGRIGELPSEQTFEQFAQNIKRLLGLRIVKAGGERGKSVRKVALCGGSAAELWTAAAAKGADVFISGDIKYHTAQDMLAAGLSFIDAGHFYSELPVVEKLYQFLTARCAQLNYAVQITVAKNQKDTFDYF